MHKQTCIERSAYKAQYGACIRNIPPRRLFGPCKLGYLFERIGDKQHETFTLRPIARPPQEPLERDPHSHNDGHCGRSNRSSCHKRSSRKSNSDSDFNDSPSNNPHNRRRNPYQERLADAESQNYTQVQSAPLNTSAPATKSALSKKPKSPKTNNIAKDDCREACDRYIHSLLSPENPPSTVKSGKIDNSTSNNADLILRRIEIQLQGIQEILQTDHSCKLQNTPLTPPLPPLPFCTPNICPTINPSKKRKVLKDDKDSCCRVGCCFKSKCSRKKSERNKFQYPGNCGSATPQIIQCLQSGSYVNDLVSKCVETNIQFCTNLPDYVDTNKTTTDQMQQTKLFLKDVNVQVPSAAKTLSQQISAQPIVNDEYINKLIRISNEQYTQAYMIWQYNQHPPLCLCNKGVQNPKMEGNKNEGLPTTSSDKPKTVDLYNLYDGDYYPFKTTAMDKETKEVLDEKPFSKHVAVLTSLENDKAQTFEAYTATAEPEILPQITFSEIVTVSSQAKKPPNVLQGNVKVVNLKEGDDAQSYKSTRSNQKSIKSLQSVKAIFENDRSTHRSVRGSLSSQNTSSESVDMYGSTAWSRVISQDPGVIVDFTAIKDSQGPIQDFRRSGESLLEDISEKNVNHSKIMIHMATSPILFPNNVTPTNTSIPVKVTADISTQVIQSIHELIHVSTSPIQFPKTLLHVSTSPIQLIARDVISAITPQIPQTIQCTSTCHIKSGHDFINLTPNIPKEDKEIMEQGSSLIIKPDDNTFKITCYEVVDAVTNTKVTTTKERDIATLDCLCDDIEVPILQVNVEPVDKQLIVADRSSNCSCELGYKNILMDNKDAVTSTYPIFKKEQVVDVQKSLLPQAYITNDLNDVNSSFLDKPKIRPVGYNDIQVLYMPKIFTKNMITNTAVIPQTDVSISPQTSLISNCNKCEKCLSKLPVVIKTATNTLKDPTQEETCNNTAIKKKSCQCAAMPPNNKSRVIYDSVVKRPVSNINEQKLRKQDNSKFKKSLEAQVGVHVDNVLTLYRSKPPPCSDQSQLPRPKRSCAVKGNKENNTNNAVGLIPIGPSEKGKDLEVKSAQNCPCASGGMSNIKVIIGHKSDITQLKSYKNGVVAIDENKKNNKCSLSRRNCSCSPKPP